MGESIRLWELSAEIKELESAIALVEENENLSEAEKAIQLEQKFSEWLEVGESFHQKAEQVARYIRHQEALAEVRKEEAKRIRALAQQAENSAARLRNYLITQMTRTGIKKIDGVHNKISLRKKQPSVSINIPVEELPDEYVKVSYKADLIKIKQLLKEDTEKTIDWASLSEDDNYSVTIR